MVSLGEDVLSTFWCTQGATRRLAFVCVALQAAGVDWPVIGRRSSPLPFQRFVRI